MKSPKLLKF